MDPRILTICPSYNRPELCSGMIETFHETQQANNTIILGLDISDEKITQYQEINKVNKILCKAGSTVTNVINSIFNQYPDYDFYHITNDDVEYFTKGWDKKFINMAEEYGHGIFYANDLFQGENMPTFPCISGEIARAVGWLQMPMLNRYCGDVVWKFIGGQCNCLYYLGNVFIKHGWEGCTHPDIHKLDMAEFATWLKFSQRDINKIKEIVCQK